MAKSTFSGPVRSLAGFISAGNATVVSLTADTTLTVAAHSGKILTCNDADGKFTLPSIVATAPGRDDDPNQLNNLGASFFFVVETAATDMDILTDGTDKFVGGLYTGKDDATGKTFISAASLLPIYSPPTNLSVPSVLISTSVAAVSITKVKEAPKLLV